MLTLPYSFADRTPGTSPVPHGAFVLVLLYPLFLGLEGLYPHPVPCLGNTCWVQTATSTPRLRPQAPSRLGLSSAVPLWPQPWPRGAFVCLPPLWPGPSPLCRWELSFTQLSPQPSATLMAEVESGPGGESGKGGAGWRVVSCTRKIEHQVCAGHTCLYPVDLVPESRGGSHGLAGA